MFMNWDREMVEYVSTLYDYDVHARRIESEKGLRYNKKQVNFG